ncbi:hypothetical protein [Kushneria aurantia]|uniref:Uncharacterized protein n=1 Tax=Kushneria aurantia TaxID=504092 RepID=A0ABV6G4W9_9GAMM|nr:hypothetical protein [Kushneria aurantia]
MQSQADQKYFDIFLAPILTCKNYKPKLGAGGAEGVNLQKFHEIYGEDPFYSWIGVNSDLMYAAHKAAGGMTSVYRQIGIGCERLFREIIFDQAEYTDRALATWSYTAQTRSGKAKTLSLDGRLELNEIVNQEVKNSTEEWLRNYCSELEVQYPQNGIVFEVRQGYKSKDSKRQNGDIDNATVAWSKGYLPVFSVFSSQIDNDIVMRYRNNSCGILMGLNNENPNISLFAFCRQVLGYDMAAFFERNSAELREQIEAVLEKLLRAE